MSTWVKKLPAVAVTLAIAMVFAPVATAYALTAPVGSVSGSVKSANTGAALADVTVRVFDMKAAEMVAEVTTDEDGALDFSELPFGLYQITVVAPEGYASAAGPLVNLTENDPDAAVAFNLEALPNAPAPAQLGGFPLWALFALIGAGVGITAGVIAINNGNPDVPVGTQ